jgi:protein gp37
VSDHSAIEWTEATWNPTYGCTKVSPGCAHCYIERTPPFRIAGRKFVNGAIDIELHQHRLDEPLHWRKPRRVFVNSLSDLFHEDIPDAFLDRVFAVMALTPQHTYQVLTKRAERMRRYMADTTRPAKWDAALLWATAIANRSRKCFVQRDGVEDFPLSNVWLGVSVENQRFADERIPLLLRTPAAVRFISAEPLLGPINLGDYLIRTGLDPLGVPEIQGWLLDWVIVGGESGPGARPFDVAWARSILQQCQVAGVPVFVKQLGAQPVEFRRDGIIDQPRVCWPLRDKKGGDPAEWPADLRVREYPKGVSVESHA